MALCCEKGLCYNCDEKWNSTHLCKGRVLLFIAENTTSKPDNPNPDFSTPSSLCPEPVTSLDLEPITDTNPPHISLHALSGLPSSETFRLFNVINHAHLTILIDSGSTHNFLQPHIAQFLHLPTQSTSPLHVLVGNGSILNWNQICPDTPLTLKGHPFTVTFHLLPISGVDAVLGIEWLRQFGPITTDYTSSIMKFTHLGRQVKLHADVAIGTESVSAPQVKRLIQTGLTSALFHLCLTPANPPDPPHHLPHAIPVIEALLTQF